MIKDAKVVTTSSPTNATTPDLGSGSHPSGDGIVIAAAVVCTVAAIFAMFIAMYCYLRRVSSGQLWLSKFYVEDQYSSMQDENVKEEQFIIGFANPMMNTAEQCDGKTAGVKILGYRPLDTDAFPKAIKDHSLRYKFLFPRDRLAYEDELGSGWFGKVYEGEASRIIPGVRRTKVIIKKLDVGRDSRTKLRFVEELDVLRRIDHKNVLGILGQALEMEPYLVVFEYSPLGDLKRFLISHRGAAHSLEERGLLLRVSRDIVSGLSCLHMNNIHHSDLSARNCIVASDLTVKIGDYGISRSLYEGDYYALPDSSQESAPLRWLAPENITYNVDSGLTVHAACVKSNIWALGVTLWEVVEFGRQPYQDLTDDEVIQTVLVDRLYQLPEPRQSGHVSKQLYEVMKTCWLEPSKRASLQDVETSLVLMSKELTPHSAPKETQENKDLKSAVNSQLLSSYTQPVAIVKPLQHVNTDQSHSDWIRFDSAKTGNAVTEISDKELIENDLSQGQKVSDIGDKDCVAMVTTKRRASDDVIPVTEIDCVQGTEGVVYPAPPVTYIGGPTVGEQSSSGLYTEGEHPCSGLYTKDGESSSGLYTEGEHPSSGLYTKDGESSSGLYTEGDDPSSGLYTHADEFMRALYSAADDQSEPEDNDFVYPEPSPPNIYTPEGIRSRQSSINSFGQMIQPSIEGGRIVEVKYSEGADGSRTPSVIIESQPSGYVVMPDEMVRRKSSLRRADAVSQGKSVHYPMNILDLRVVHRYYCEEEEYDHDVTMGTSSTDTEGPSMSQARETDVTITTDQPISEQDRTDNKGHGIKERTSDAEVSTAKFQAVKDSHLLLVDIPDRNESTFLDNDDRPTSPRERLESPIEKKMKKISRKSKAKDQEDEWLISIEKPDHVDTADE